MHSDIVRRAGSAGRRIATGRFPFSMTISIPARTRSKIDAKSLAASASETWTTLFRITELYIPKGKGAQQLALHRCISQERPTAHYNALFWATFPSFSQCRRNRSSGAPRSPVATALIVHRLVLIAPVRPEVYVGLVFVGACIG